MEAWVRWGTGVIQWVQSFGNPTLDALFKGITFLGDEMFYLLWISLLYWAVNRALAIRLGFLCLGSAYVYTSLKALFAVPRPAAPAVRVVTSAEGYAFPSGHAQTAATGWFYLASQVGRASLWIFAIVVVLLVGLSRVYLGVHYPQDVVAGTAIGLALVGGYTWIVNSQGERFGRLGLAAKLTLACAVPLLLLMLHVEKDTVSSMCTLLGLGVGATLEGQWVRFQSGGPAVRRLLRFVLGVLVLLVLYFGLKAVLPEAPVFRGLRYGLLGLWGSLGAPWWFVRLRLADAD